MSTSTPAAGWYPQRDHWRYWDGQAWTAHTAPLPAVHERVNVHVTAPGGRGRSVTRQRKRTSHTFHLLMTVFTGGAWALFVWLPLASWHRIGPRRRVVTRYR